MPTRFDRAVSSRRPAPSRMMALSLAALLPMLLIADMIGATQPAAAQQGFGNFFTYQKPRPRRAAKRKPAPAAEAADKTQSANAKTDAKKPAEKSGPAQPLTIVVSLGDQHATIYDADNNVVTRTRVSTGQPGHRTPTGVFSIIGKERWHRSNIYSGAPMPYMQRITWSGVAMHAGVVPGYPASHGCIRLPAGFAPQLYGMTKMGNRVVVSPRDVQPVEFSHPLLPQPKMHEAPIIPISAQQTSTTSPLELVSVATTAADKNGETAAAPGPKMLNPIAYASALKQRAAADKAAADLAAKNALAAAQAAGVEARQASEDVRKAEAELRASEAKLAEVAARAAAPAPTVQPAATDAAAQQPAAISIEAEKAAAEAAVTRAQSALAEARAHEAAKSPIAFAAVETWKRAATAAAEAGDLIEQAERRREQVSVFISKKEGRVFIRQDWKDVWEAPITVRDPDRPLGTHVYTLVSAAPDGSSTRWTAISMPPETPSGDGRRGRDKDKNATAAPAPAAPETAAGALDRIELPEGAREKIAELLWMGGSLIVSDQPRSYEMSDNATDFIVLTR